MGDLYGYNGELPNLLYSVVGSNGRNRRELSGSQGDDAGGVTTNATAIGRITRVVPHVTP